jgi:hypothetical protein
MKIHQAVKKFMRGDRHRQDGDLISLFLFLESRVEMCEPGSSVSIVSGYGLDDRAMEVRSPADAKGFFL